MLSSFCARCDSRRDATTPSSASCRSVLRPPLCVLPRTSQKAEGSCSRIVISGARTALSPWLWARIDFVDGASSRPLSPLHNGGWCTHYCDIVATIRFRNRVPYIENARGRAFVVREAGGRNFRLGIIQAPPLWRISGWFIACSLGTFFLSFFLSLVERGGNARRVAFYSVAKRLRYSL